jgi:lipopolysaccharide transport system permease protein
MAWMYLTPIFYPESIVPPRYHWLVRWNSMAAADRMAGGFCVEGRQPDWTGLAAATMGFAICCLLVGYWWFVRTRKAFADVL